MAAEDKGTTARPTLGKEETTARPVMTARPAVAATPQAPTTKFVRMVKIDATVGRREEIDVHPKAVEAHKQAGWHVS